MTSVFQSMTWRINLWKQIHVYNGDSFHEGLWWLCKFPFSFNLFEKISNLEFQNIIWIKIGKFFHNLLHRYVNTYGNKMIEHLRSSQNPTEISKKKPLFADPWQSIHNILCTTFLFANGLLYTRYPLATWPLRRMGQYYRMNSVFVRAWLQLVV